MSELARIGQFGQNGCFDKIGLTILMSELQESGVAAFAEGPAMLALGERLLSGCVRAPGTVDGCSVATEVNRLRDYVSGQEPLRLELAVERGRERRLTPLSKEHTELAAVVDRAAVTAYSLFAHASSRTHGMIRTRRGAEWPIDGSCGEMSLIMQQLLRRESLETVAMIGRVPSQLFYSHTFLQTQDAGIAECTIDTTWQQFLSNETDFDALPHTMLFPTSEAEAALAAHGIPERWQGLWVNAKPSKATWRDYAVLGERSIEAVFVEQGWA